MHSFFIALASTLSMYSLEGFMDVRRSNRSYVCMFFIIWGLFFCFDGLRAYDEVWLDSDLRFIESIDVQCLSPQQRREIVMKALDHRKEGVRAFKQVEYYANQMGLMNNETADELVHAAIAGICTRPYQWSSVVSTLIIFSLEHSWNLVKTWTQIESELNKGKYHVEMFEFYKQILDNG